MRPDNSEPQPPPSKFARLRNFFAGGKTPKLAERDSIEEVAPSPTINVSATPTLSINGNGGAREETEIYSYEQKLKLELEEERIRVRLREDSFAEYLAGIDPVLKPLANQLAKSHCKDFSNIEHFMREQERLETTDLVLVHLTNTFPKDGILHPKVYYDPNILRYSIHFTVNSTAQHINYFGRHTSWANKKYAILVPFDKIKTRIDEFHPGDTWILDDLELPEGSVVIKDKTDQISPSVGKAQLIEADFSQQGQVLYGSERAIYEQIVSLGYFPFDRANSLTGWSGEWATGTCAQKILKEFSERNEVRLGAGHWLHWSARLAMFSASLERIAESKDEEAFINAVNGPETTLAMLLGRQHDMLSWAIPEKYRDALTQLVEKYRREVFPDSQT